MKETGNAYWEGNSPARITYADTDTARDPVWRSNLLSTPETSAHQARLVNAGLAGLATSPGARRLESYVWGLTVAELLKTQLWSDIRKRWQDWQNGQGLSQPPQNTVTNQNDPTASPSKDDTGKAAKKGEAQGQAGAGMPSPEDPDDPNHKKKGNGDQTSKPEPDSGPRPPWENENGELRGKLENGKVLNICPKDGDLVGAAQEFEKQVKACLEAQGITWVRKREVPMAGKGSFTTDIYSDGTSVGYRAPGQSSWRTDKEMPTVDVNGNPKIMREISGGGKTFKVKFGCKGK